ncbi:hypothetical protein [Ensifer soli]|uniref:hypothetical protein n=1 Tax=Ciceribacter sp. sgz301302 TaxID=3342379 RepID=UPI0035B77829
MPSFLSARSVAAAGLAALMVLTSFQTAGARDRHDGEGRRFHHERSDRGWSDRGAEDLTPLRYRKKYRHRDRDWHGEYRYEHRGRHSGERLTRRDRWREREERRVRIEERAERRRGYDGNFYGGGLRAYREKGGLSIDRDTSYRDERRGNVIVVTPGYNDGCSYEAGVCVVRP